MGTQSQRCSRTLSRLSRPCSADLGPTGAPAALDPDVLRLNISQIKKMEAKAAVAENGWKVFASGIS